MGTSLKGKNLLPDPLRAVPYGMENHLTSLESFNFILLNKLNSAELHNYKILNWIMGATPMVQESYFIYQILINFNCTSINPSFWSIV